MDPLSLWTLKINQTYNYNFIIQILIIFICVILSAFFAACETALSYSDYYTIETLSLSSEKKSLQKKAKRALRILNNNDKTIIDNLIYINFLHITASTIMTVLMLNLVKDEDLAAILSTVIITIVIFCFSETMPKTIANLNPEKSLLNLSGFITIFGIICYPISLIFRLFVKLLKSFFKLKNENDMDEEEFVSEIEDSENNGYLEDEESDIIQAAVNFGEFSVEDVMTKKDDMVCYDALNSSRKQVLNFVKDITYSRIPVYEGNIDNIIGILHIKKYLLNCYDEEKQIRFKSMLSKPLFVLNTTKIDDMFKLFQQKRNHIAIVKNNQGNVLGMVTMEDVVEKLVGDIDEVNPPKVFEDKEEEHDL